MNSKLLFTILFAILLATQALGTQCPQKVQETRKKIKNMAGPERKEFAQKLKAKLTEKFPSVEERKVTKFVRNLYSASAPQTVCGQYKRVFGGEEKPKCPELVEKVRAKFNALETKEEKKEFVVKVVKRLTTKYPETPKPKVLFFVGALLKGSVPAKKVCLLRKKIFKPEQVQKVEDDKPKCPAVVEKVRAKFSEIETKEEKKEFIKKVYSKLTTKYPEVSKRKVAVFILALLKKAVAPKKVCALKRKLFKKPEQKVVVAKDGKFECILKCARKHLSAIKLGRLIRKCKRDKQCYIDALKESEAAKCVKECQSGDKIVKDDKPECPELVEKVRAKFAELETREKKRQFVKKVVTKLTEKYPNVKKAKVLLFVGALLNKKVEAKKVCELKKRLFKPEEVKYDKPECPAVVEKVRAKFAELETRQEKRQFVKKVVTKLTEKYPNVKKVKVVLFVGALLKKEVEPKTVCALKRRLFKKPEQKVVVAKDGKFECILKCARKHLSAIKLGRLVRKCKRDKQCYIDALKESEAAKCVKECVGDKVVGEKPKCGEIVKKIRAKFAELETRQEKKEFVKKIYKRLTSKYPKVSRRKVAVFILALLKKSVSPTKVCALKRKLFKRNGGKRKCAKIVKKIRAKFAELETKEEKKEFVKKVYKGLTTKYPTVSRKKVALFIVALLSRKVCPVLVCKLRRKLFKRRGENGKPTCEKIVTKIRAKFAELETKEEKKAMVKKLFTKLNAKYPGVRKPVVFFFLKSLLVKRVPARVTCALKRKIFKKPASTEEIIDEVEYGVPAKIEENVHMVFAN